MPELSLARNELRRDGDLLAEKAYRFADLSEYPFKKRLVIRVADLAFYALINLIGRTLRFDVQGWENWEAASRDGRIPIYTFWHEDIVLATYFFQRRDIIVMTSQSFDGEYIARFIQRFGYGAVRGSSTRGGIGAVIELVRLMRLGKPAALAIDGPKGPRHVAKMGSVLLAKKTGHPVLPFTITPTRCWTLRSWDGFRIPKPFITAHVQIGTPIFVPANADDTALETHRSEVQAALEELERRGQQWHKTQMQKR